jgi:hypothetical protein
MSCIDADDRHFRKTAFVNETEECAVSADAGEKVFITRKLFNYFIAEFLNHRDKFIVGYSGFILLITEHIYLHFTLSV